MASLRTDYKDDVLSGDRKYRMVNNPDGTVSFVDVTDYTQEGDTFGASDVNATNTAVNALQEANGDTDISDIGDGTNTGAIHELNTHLSSKADKVWTVAGYTGTVGGAVTVPTTGLSELLLVGALNINGQAEISGSVIIPMQFLVQDRNFRIQLGFASEVGQIQIGYIKSESKFFIANEYYSVGSIFGRAMEVYYR